MKSFSAGVVCMVVLLVLAWQTALGQVTLVLKKVPIGTPASDTLFLAGNINNWNHRSSAHMFVRAANQQYYLTVPELTEVLEFKITRGSWAKGEILANGAARGNRGFSTATAADSLYIEVENWQDNFSASTKPHTASANVQFLSHTFWMPQLNKSRRIWLYLPSGYHLSKKRYPVLYMHDGQNLFDSFYSYSGEWEVDETLDQLARRKKLEIVVVGIENGGEERINEYTPWHNKQYGGGKGDAYVDFLVQTLKPYIDSHYRTLPGKTTTGVAGSSMGGLISLYAAVKYPEVYGRVGVFSPAFWLSPELYQYVEQCDLLPSTKLYLMAGAREGEQMVPDM
ncbi:alpha/beta hydrolase [Rufibacter roseus]|uniref:Alpha/beta hydrolase n=1 Tax=Rufibacter roseus TaxID=1567108 RepID=A0ABW2DRY9_9BACT|nr:alpha/beta hydrolase-fold protein [Rufibacter roseus]